MAGGRGFRLSALSGRGHRSGDGLKKTEVTAKIGGALKPTVSNDLNVTYKPADAVAPKKRQASVMPPPREGALRIVSWDLSTLPAMEGGRANEETQASWRTSFGSERSTAPETLTGGARYDLKADVILLQGISDATLLRRYFFPARYWHLMVARQKLTDIAMQADPASAAAGITGVAIRVREGLRITAREYFPRIGGRAGRARRQSCSRAPRSASSIADARSGSPPCRPILLCRNTGPVHSQSAPRRMAGEQASAGGSGRCRRHARVFGAGQRGTCLRAPASTHQPRELEPADNDGGAWLARVPDAPSPWISLPQRNRSH